MIPRGALVQKGLHALFVLYPPAGDVLDVGFVIQYLFQVSQYSFVEIPFGQAKGAHRAMGQFGSPGSGF